MSRMDGKKTHTTHTHSSITNDGFLPDILMLTQAPTIDLYGSMAFLLDSLLLTQAPIAVDYGSMAFLPDILLLTHAPIAAWFDGIIMIVYHYNLIFVFVVSDALARRLT